MFATSKTEVDKCWVKLCISSVTLKLPSPGTLPIPLPLPVPDSFPYAATTCPAEAFALQDGHFYQGYTSVIAPPGLNHIYAPHTQPSLW